MRLGVLFGLILLLVGVLAVPAEAAASGPGAWLPVPDLPVGRGSVAAATGSDGRIYAIGGAAVCQSLSLRHCGSANSVQAFDPSTGAWTAAAPIPSGGRRNHSVIADGSGRIYVVGGEMLDDEGFQQYTVDVPVLDTATGTWSYVQRLNEMRVGSSAAAGRDGRIYLLGGNMGDWSYFPSLFWTEVWALSLDGWGWDHVADHPFPRLYAAAATAPDGRILYFGGIRIEPGQWDQRVVARVDAFDPTTGAWSQLTDMPVARHHHVAVAGPDGRIYLYGGLTNLENMTPTTRVDVYDPATDRWSSATNLTIGHSELGGALGRDGRLYALGGYDAALMPSAHAEALDLTAAPPSPTPTRTGTSTPIRTPTAVHTPTPTQTRTRTATVTLTRTLTRAATTTRTRTATRTLTATRTRTATVPTRTRTATRTVTATRTATRSRTVTPTRSTTRTGTATPTRTAVPRLAWAPGALDLGILAATTTEATVNVRVDAPVANARLAVSRAGGSVVAEGLPAMLEPNRDYPVRLRVQVPGAASRVRFRAAVRLLAGGRVVGAPLQVNALGSIVIPARATWEPARLERTLAPGASVATSVRLRVSQPVESASLTLYAPPGWARVDTTALPARLEAGRAYDLPVTLSVPASTRAFRQTAVLYLRNGGRTVTPGLAIRIMRG
jgi:N-acetylneuraminic acid mutarotase